MEGLNLCGQCALAKELPAELNDTHLRYLMTIYQLSLSGKEVSSIDIARFLHIKKASVTKMTTILMEKKLVVKERYSKIYLTCSGALTAKRLTEQAQRLAELIQHQMNLSAELSQRAACAAVCAISDHEASPVPQNS